MTSAQWLCEKLLLIRREVLTAVGGVDEGYELDHMAIVDLCLKARQRNFKCIYLGAVQFVCHDSLARRGSPTDLKRLQQKWGSYRELLEHVEQN